MRSDYVDWERDHLRHLQEALLVQHQAKTRMESSHAAGFDGTIAGISIPQLLQRSVLRCACPLVRTFSCCGRGRKDFGILGLEALPAHAVFAGYWDRPAGTVRPRMGHRGELLDPSRIRGE